MILTTDFKPISQTAANVRDFYNRNANRVDDSHRRNSGYYRELESMLRSVVLPGQTVLDLGCGNGDLLAALSVSEGVGIDLSGEMIKIARRKHNHPGISFLVGDIEDGRIYSYLQRQFDVIILQNVITEIHDVQAVFEALHEVCHARTRIIVFSYSRVWQIPLQIAEKVGIKIRNPVNNWLNSYMVGEMEKVDLVVLCASFHHCFNWSTDILFSKIKAILASGGLILVANEHYVDHWFILHRFMSFLRHFSRRRGLFYSLKNLRAPYPSDGEHWRTKKEEIEAIFKRNGFYPKIFLHAGDLCKEDVPFYKKMGYHYYYAILEKV